ncbi:MAG TPA: PQQ-dependent sugar dehydrogenase [Candidatus Limnocylindrales bacterium]
MTNSTAFAPRSFLRSAAAGAVLASTLLAGLLPARAAALSATPLTDGAGALSAPSGSTIDLTPVASGLANPVLFTSAHDGTGRMFIVEQTGAIRVFDNGSVLPGNLLNLAGSISHGDEQGLLGLAFHPNFENNRKFYVNYTNRGGDTLVREYKTSTSNPNRVQSGSGRTILKVHQPYSNHNGGNLAFGPGGYLYIGLGDGGDAGDPGRRAQDKNSLLGKMLRIDVDSRSGNKAYGIPKSNPYVGEKGKNEIFQRGLRNPWRYSFDRSNGNLWIGDVGQGGYEEIDRTTSGNGTNWGWRVMEGYKCYSPSSGCNKDGKKKPVAVYSHANGRCAVTGGYVYRGSNIPALRGWYVFGDYCSGEIWAVSSTASDHKSKILLRDSNASISSFGENAGGELFVVGRGGTIYRIDQG